MFFRLLILLVFLFLGCMLNAQTYTFDTMVTYSFESKNRIVKSVSYVNSKDSNYRLVYRDGGVRLYDSKNKTTHIFNVNYDQKNTHFSLVDSRKEDYYKDWNPNYIYDFKEIESSDNFKKVRLNIYKNKKRKKAVMSYDLLLKSNEFNLFYTFRGVGLHPFEFTERLNFKGNYIVESAEGYNLTGKEFKIKLTEFQKVDFSLQVP